MEITKTDSMDSPLIDFFLDDTDDIVGGIMVNTSLLDFSHSEKDIFGSESNQNIED